MRSLQRVSVWKRILYSKVFAGVLVIFVIYMTYVVWGMYGKYQNTQENVAMATMKLEEEKERKIDLSTKVNRLQTTEGVESELRKKFLIAEEGEQVMVIVDEDGEQSKMQKNDVNDEESWWESFLSIF